VKHNFKQIKDGGAFELKDSVPHSIVCCDCGLVHNLDVKHKKGTVAVLIVTVERDNRATGQKRRWMKKRGIHNTNG